MRRIRILVADDHAMLRTTLTEFLADVDGFQIVGQAADGREAVDQVASARPDLVVMDVSMPRLGGIEATRRILHQWPKVRVLAMSQHCDSETLGAMLEAGARGFVVKKDGVAELARAIVTVAGGDYYLSPSLARPIAESLLQDRRSRRSGDTGDRLTGRECEVLQLIAEGHTTRDIAEDLGLSVRTVEAHRQRIMVKLGTKTVAGLTKWAVRHRLTSLEN